MLRLFCSTNRCGYLARAGSCDRAAADFGRRERDALVEQVGVLAAENARLRAQFAERDAALVEANASTEFYLDLFCAERARQGAGR